jgi:hypothetical protein
MRKRFLAACALAALAACGTDHMSTGGGTQVLLTDAPFPFDQVSAVNVFIVSVDATTNPDTTTAQTWTTLVAPNRVFNLLDVQNGHTTLLGQTQVAAGQYAAIRMVIRTDLSGITLSDGSTAAVNWLGGATQTINALVEQPLSITTGGGNGGNLIIDFDVGRSFILLPGGGFQFLPWIRAVNEDATGAISGVVTGADGGAAPGPVAKASVAVYSGGGTNALQLAATGVTDASGRFTIHYISGGGPYVVEAAPPTGFQAAPGYTGGVMVTPGQTSSADVQLNTGSGSGGHLKIVGPSQVGVGDAITLTAYVFNANGDSVSGAPVVWSNPDPTVARLDGSGASVQLTGVSPGAVPLEAWSNDMFDSVVVTVTGVNAPVATVQVVPESLFIAVGDSVALQAIARDSFGSVLNGRPIAWSVDSSVVHVLDSFTNYILVRGIAAGTSTVTATVEGKQGHSTVHVH